jgi:hypothetical protein
MLGWLLIAAIAAGAAPVSVVRCKKSFVPGSGSQFVGRASWQDDAQQTIVGSTEDRTVGSSVLTCTVKLPSRSTSAVLDFGGARVAFGNERRPLGTGGSGLAITVNTPSVCTISGLRVDRENWMELGPAAYALQFSAPVDRLTLVFKLIDSSSDAALRADINPVEIRAARPGESVLPCPPAVR